MLSPKNIHSDAQLQKITGQIVVGLFVLVAHDLGLFSKLCSSPLSAKNLAKSMNLEERPVQAMLSCASSMGLTESSNGVYSLSPLGKSFLDKDSPTYYGYVLDLLVQESEIMSFSKIKKAITSNSPQFKNKDIFSNKHGIGSTEEFVKAIHHKALAPAFYWTARINLNSTKTLVDIAGGSGIHTIAACINNPHISGIVCDRLPVLKQTDKYIKLFGVKNKIKSKSLDIWKDPFPIGDTYFLADIFHDWSLEKCVSLAKKCYASIPDQGRIIVHEMLFDKEKMGPLLTSAYNAKMLLWTEGCQYSFSELKFILQEAGFVDVEQKKGLGNWSVIIGIKDRRSN